MLPTTPLPFADVADIDENGVIARGPDDISYLRPLVNGRRERVPAATDD
ncbi:MAG: hypothetical protein HKN19_06255 [Halioglobus sp.]|nr:hypothetical protein [Halioglobus sp.]